MPKLPVFATVGRAYSFAFGNLGMIFRLCWFPFLIGLLPAFLSPLLTRSVAPPLGVLLSLVIGVVVVFVQIFCVSMALVAIHRAILFNDRRPGTLLLFSVGRTELLFAAIPIAIQVAVIAAALALAPAAMRGQISLQQIPPGLIFLVFFAVWFVMVYISIRLIPLYPAIVVRERLAFREAWRLSRGNFWRILGANTVLVVPIFVVFWVISFVLSQVLGLQAISSNPGTVKEFSPIIGIVGALVGFVIVIPLTGLGVGFLSYTYKALAGFAPDEIVPSRA